MQENVYKKFPPDFNLNYIAELNHFIKCCKGQESPRATLEEGIETMQLILSSYESEAMQICRDVVLIEFLKKIIVEDVGKKFEKNNYIATMLKNNLEASVRQKESNISKTVSNCKIPAM